MTTAVSAAPKHPPAAIKRTTFHQVSRKHLDRYLDEFEFRYKNRKNAYLFRDTLTRLVQNEAMPSEQLTA